MRRSDHARGAFAFGWKRFGSVSAADSRYRSGRSVWIFLAPGCFALKARPTWVGLSWISLDSLVRIETYQWVTRHKVGKFFSLAFPLTSRGPGTGACGRGHAEAQDCSWAKLTLVSDFLQTIVREFLQKWRALILWGEAKEDDSPMSPIVRDNLARAQRSMRDRSIPDCMFSNPPLTPVLEQEASWRMRANC